MTEIIVDTLEGRVQIHKRDQRGTLYRHMSLTNREATELYYALGAELSIGLSSREATEQRLAVLEEQVRKVDQFNERLSAVETLHRDYAEIREKMQVFGTFEN